MNRYHWKANRRNKTIDEIILNNIKLKQFRKLRTEGKTYLEHIENNSRIVVLFAVINKHNIMDRTFSFKLKKISGCNWNKKPNSWLIIYCSKENRLKYKGHTLKVKGQKKINQTKVRKRKLTELLFSIRKSRFWGKSKSIKNNRDILYWSKSQFIIKM